MKIHEILPEQEIDESAWRKAIAAGALSAAAMASPNVADSPNSPEPQRQEQTSRYEAPKDEIVSYGSRADVPNPGDQLRQSEMTNKIASFYRVNRDMVGKVVDLAFQYEDPIFPRAEDILSVIGVESSFNPRSVSALSRDPALGLMQVRPGVWNIDPSQLDDLENQIKHGVTILKKYHNKLQNPEDTLQAYNLGITRFRRGDRNPRYVAKVDDIKNELFSD